MVVRHLYVGEIFSTVPACGEHKVVTIERIAPAGAGAVRRNGREHEPVKVIGKIDLTDTARAVAYENFEVDVRGPAGVPAGVVRQETDPAVAIGRLCPAQKGLADRGHNARVALSLKSGVAPGRIGMPNVNPCPLQWCARVDIDDPQA